MTELETIGSTIRNVRKRNKMSMKTLGEKVGLSESMIWRYEKGDLKSIDMQMIKKIAEALHVTPESLLGWQETHPSNLLPVPETKKIPLLGTIACGEPMYADQEFSYIEGPIKADFCLRASGDSMIGARIHDGDLVFCREQPEVDNGEIAVVVIDDVATLKRFYQYGETVVLKPENSDYKEMVYSGDQIGDVRIIGKAVAFQSTLK